jgi:hypothetical protein
VLEWSEAGQHCPAEGSDESHGNRHQEFERGNQRGVRGARCDSPDNGQRFVLHNVDEGRDVDHNLELAGVGPRRMGETRDPT